MPSSIAPFSPTKSMIASAPSPSVISLTVSTWLPSTLTVWSAPTSPASASAFSDGSITMISVAVIAFRHWIPMWPRPPAPITTALVPPAGVLVPGRVGQLHLGLLSPLTLLDVQVGPAQAGGADPHHHVERAKRLRFVDVVELQLLVVRVQPRGSHPTTSSGSSIATP